MSINKEINWNKEISEAHSLLTLEEKRMEQLKIAALDLRDKLGIKEILLSIKEQVLEKSEITLDKVGGFAKSLYLSTPISCSFSDYLSSDINIEVPPKSVPVYEGPISEDIFVGYRTIPGFNCKGVHSLGINTYAGFEDINKLSFSNKVGGRDEYLKSNLLNKTGKVSIFSTIYPIDKNIHGVSSGKRILEEYFDRDNFSIAEINKNIINSLAKYFSSENLRNVTIHQV